MDNLGYFGIEFETISLGLNKGIIDSKDDFETFETKLSVELKKAGVAQDKIFKWRSPVLGSAETEKIESRNFKSTLIDSDEYPYLSTSTFVDNFTPKSAYIGLDDDTINQLSNCDIVIQVTSNSKATTSSTPAVVSNKVAKGKTTVDVASENNTSADILFEITIPLSQLLGSKSTCIDFDEKNTLDTYLTSPNNIKCKIMNETLIVPSQCFLKLKLYGDNDLAEFLYGGCIYQYKSIKLSEMSSDMTVQQVDVSGGKATKSPAKGKGPDPSDAKAKAIEAISKVISEQSKYVNFQVTLDMQEQTVDETSADNKEDEVAANDPNIPKTKVVSVATASHCAGGVLDFNKVAATAAAPEIDLCNIKELWTVGWNSSPYHFLHRSKLRRILAASKNPDTVSLAVSFQKSTTAEGLPVMGAESSLQVSLDLPFSVPEPGLTEYPIAVYFGKTPTAVPAAEGAETPATDSDYFNLFEAILSFVQPLLPVPPASANTTHTAVVTPTEVKIVDRNVDVMEEFRQDIKNIVVVIAQEFVKMKTQQTDQQKAELNNITLNNNSNNMNENQMEEDFPDNSFPAVAVVAADTSGASGSSYEKLKAEFMSFLSTSGILHSFKEKLRPRIMQIIYDRCGPKGLALGKSLPINQNDEDGDSPFTRAPSLAEVGTLLNDVYVCLIQESNTVLNSLFASTLVAHQATSLDKKPYINDEVETSEQAFIRLGFQAYNAQSDTRYQASEQYHLERLCLAKTLSESIPTGLFEAYTAYSNLYLYQTMQAITITTAMSAKTNQTDANNNNNRSVELNNLMLKCHQILSLTHNENPSNVQTLLLLACSHARLDRQYEAEKTLLSTINMAVDRGNELYSLDDLLNVSGNVDGTDSSDLEINLKTVDPLCYCVLAGILSLKTEFKNPLLVRKAILMATYAYETYQTANVTSILFNDYIADEMYGHGNIPRRTAVLCLVKSAIFLFEKGYATVASEIYNLALSCEKASNQKAQFRNLPSMTPPFIRALLKRAEFYSVWMSSAYVEGDISDSLKSKLFDIAIDCCDVSRATDDVGDMQWGHIAMFRSLNLDSAVDSPMRACEHLLQAIHLSHSAVSNEVDSGSDDNKKQLPPPPSFPLELLIQIGRTLIQMGRYNDAISYLSPFIKTPISTGLTAVNGIDYQKSSTLHLIIGICYLRQEMFVDAEKWINVANILEPKSSEIWSYLALICLSVHSSSNTPNSLGNRVEQAEKCVNQALRLGMTSSALIREIANSFMSTDRLVVAEDLLRLSISNSISSSSSSSSSVNDVADLWKSRKLLANILSTQNRAIEALDEYRNIVENDRVATNERIKAGEACLMILKSLDREEEAKVVQRIVDSFENMNLGDNPTFAAVNDNATM